MDESNILIKTHVDKYKNLHINLSKIQIDKLNLYRKNINDIIEKYLYSDIISIWVNIPLPIRLIHLGEILPEDFEIGGLRSNLIYDYQNNQVRVWFSFIENHSIPPGATHNLGGSALIYDNVSEKALLVVNFSRSSKWEFPGGSFDPQLDKSILDTALRETKEETGFLNNLENYPSTLVGEIYFPKNQFAPGINQVWEFEVSNVSNNKLTLQEKEIKEAEWIPKDTLLHSSHYREYEIPKELKMIFKTFIKRNGFNKGVEKSFMTVYTHNTV